MKYDFLTIGGAVEDINIYTDEGVLIDNKKDILRQKLIGFEYGAKIMIEKSESFFGGGASNAAVSLSRLGFKTAILASMGEDERGDRILDNFKNNNVVTDHIKRLKKEDTGYSLIVVSVNNEHVIFLRRGANNKFVINTEDIKTIKDSKWVYLSSLSGKWEKVLEKVFKAKNNLIWNAGSTQVGAGVNKIGKFLKKTDILLLNKDEAIELVLSHKDYKNKTNKFLNDINNLLKIVKSFGPKTVVITDGVNGAYAIDDEKTYFQDSLHVKKVVDTTGVGDAFCSSLVAGIEVYGDIQKAMKMGIKNTASVLKKAGCQNGLLKMNLKKLKKNK